uniref:Uncharacterized protein n=1 Tax=Percolomonas cosmopolitus TaxID=63605 RepID=A0A7S1KMV7_9EUKA|mmetsp:Transcript_1458/g.4976  ORF Transcript_1458/g.4976 Transcript_1458/m.4976 type:complete len:383 (+) Transcript_1458:129-1277(+)
MWVFSEVFVSLTYAYSSYLKWKRQFFSSQPISLERLILEALTRIEDKSLDADHHQDPLAPCTQYWKIYHHTLHQGLRHAVNHFYYWVRQFKRRLALMSQENDRLQHELLLAHDQNSALSITLDELRTSDTERIRHETQIKEEFLSFMSDIRSRLTTFKSVKHYMRFKREREKEAVGCVHDHPPINTDNQVDTPIKHLNATQSEQNSSPGERPRSSSHLSVSSESSLTSIADSACQPREITSTKDRIEEWHENTLECNKQLNSLIQLLSQYSSYSSSTNEVYQLTIQSTIREIESHITANQINEIYVTSILNKEESAKEHFSTSTPTTPTTPKRRHSSAATPPAESPYRSRFTPKFLKRKQVDSAPRRRSFGIDVLNKFSGKP